jgi:hypothetical protein
MLSIYLVHGCVLISVILLYKSNICHWVCRKGDTDKTESLRVQKLSHCGARITVAGVMPLSMKRGHHDLRVELFRPNEGNKKKRKRHIRRYGIDTGILSCALWEAGNLSFDT